MHRQVLFPQSRLLDLTILLAGVDAIRVVTIQAQCHIMRVGFFGVFLYFSAGVMEAHAHMHAHTLERSYLLFQFLTSYLSLTR